MAGAKKNGKFFFAPAIPHHATTRSLCSALRVAMAHGIGIAPVAVPAVEPARAPLPGDIEQVIPIML